MALPPTSLLRHWKAHFWTMPANNVKRNSQQRNPLKNCQKYLKLFAESWVLILKDMRQLLMKVYIDNPTMTRSPFTCKKTQNGLVFMMDMEEPSVLSSWNKNYMNSFSILIGEKMCRLLSGRPSLRQTISGKRKEITVEVVLWLFSSTITSAILPI